MKIQTLFTVSVAIFLIGFVVDDMTTYANFLYDFDYSIQAEQNPEVVISVNEVGVVGVFYVTVLQAIAMTLFIVSAGLCARVLMPKKDLIPQMKNKEYIKFCVSVGLFSFGLIRLSAGINNIVALIINMVV